MVVVPAYFNLQVGSGESGGGGNKSLITSLTLENLIFLKHANPLSFISLSKLTIFNGRFLKIFLSLFLDTNKNYNRHTVCSLRCGILNLSCQLDAFHIKKKEREREEIFQAPFEHVAKLVGSTRDGKAEDGLGAKIIHSPAFAEIVRWRDSRISTPPPAD